MQLFLLYLQVQYMHASSNGKKHALLSLWLRDTKMTMRSKVEERPQVWRQQHWNSRSYSPSLFRKHFNMRLMTAHDNRLLLFATQRQPSLAVPPRSHTQALSFIKRPPSLPALLTRLYLTIPATSNVAWDWRHGSEKKKKRRKKVVQEEYCEWCSVVSTWAKLKTNMRYVTKGSGWVAAQGYPLDPVSPPKLLFSSTQWRRQQTQ